MMRMSGGTTLACVRDYGQQVNLLDGVSALAEFTKVVPATALGWVLLPSSESAGSERGLPKGGTLLRLRCFLELCGYVVDELQALPEPARELAQAIGLGVLPVESAASEMGYTDAGAIYRQTVQPQYGLDADRVKLLEKLNRSTEQRRLDKSAIWRPRLEKLITPVAETTGSTTPQETEELPRVQAMDRATLPVLIGGGLQIAAVALRELDGADPDQRELILDSVWVMVGGDRLRAIGEWLRERE